MKDKKINLNQTLRFDSSVKLAILRAQCGRFSSIFIF